MDVTMHSLGLDKLPEEDRLRLAQELWESVPHAEDDEDMTAEQWAEIDRRLADDDANPDRAVDGPTFMAEMRRSTAAMKR